MVDTETKNYFDDLITNIDKKNRAYIDELNKENKRYMLDLKKSFKEDVKLVAELVASRPDTEKVREIVREEIKPLKSDVEIIKKEVGLINKELREHDKRLTRLENVLV